MSAVQRTTRQRTTIRPATPPAVVRPEAGRLSAAIHSRPGVLATCQFLGLAVLATGLMGLLVMVGTLEFTLAAIAFVVAAAGLATLCFLDVSPHSLRTASTHQLEVMNALYREISQYAQTLAEDEWLEIEPGLRAQQRELVRLSYIESDAIEALVDVHTQSSPRAYSDEMVTLHSLRELLTPADLRLHRETFARGEQAQAEIRAILDETQALRDELRALVDALSEAITPAESPDPVVRRDYKLCDHTRRIQILREEYRKLETQYPIAELTT